MPRTYQRPAVAPISKAALAAARNAMDGVSVKVDIGDGLAELLRKRADQLEASGAPRVRLAIIRGAATALDKLEIEFKVDG